MSRALVCGWPSVPGGEATAGDLLTMGEVARILEGLGLEVEMATNTGFAWGVDAAVMPVDRYAHVVFVCGPLHGTKVAELIDRFPTANRVAVNVSVVDEAFTERFDHVIERDGRDRARADLSFACRPAPVPVIGIVRSHPQPEYPRADHDRVHAIVQLALASRECATVDFDTRVHPSADPFAAHARTPAAVSSLAARMDVVVSTRLHGVVLALAVGTPVVAIDPIRGGAKLSAQMQAIGWPCWFTPETVTSEQLAQAIQWCLTRPARDHAHQITTDTRTTIDTVRTQLTTALHTPS